MGTIQRPIEITEAHQRVQAVRRVIEHDLVFGDGTLDAETTWYAAVMLAKADRFLELAAAAA